MSGEVKMSLSTEALDSGSAEERATFGLFSMTANERLLTEGVDTANQKLSHGPYVSGYPLAEWLAWNWWRLRWEFGRSATEDGACRWEFAHRLSTIGDGYVWPDITIFSDGWRMNPLVRRVCLVADFTLDVEFETGERRLFDMTPYLHRGVFVRLQEHTGTHPRIREAVRSVTLADVVRNKVLSQLRSLAPCKSIAPCRACRCEKTNLASSPVKVLRTLYRSCSTRIEDT